MSPSDFQAQHADAIAEVVEYEVDGIPTVDFVGHGGRRFGVQLPGGWRAYANPAALYEPALRGLRLMPGRSTPGRFEAGSRIWAQRQRQATGLALDEPSGPGRGLSVA